jgi:DNA-binding MarR family transcriptional regulator
MTFTLDNALGFVVGRTFHIQRRVFTATMQGADLQITPEEWVLLNRLWARDGQRQSDLAESTIKDRTTVTRLLDGMVNKGLVRRETDPDDRRVVLAWLTDEGRGLKRRLLPLLEKLLEDATVGISEKDLQITRQTLTKFQANLGDVLARLNE